MTINERIAKVREMMKKYNLSAYIIPSTDPHISEYVANCWLSRQWVSGFTGSAGTVVITNEVAGLWTDSRYFLQGEQQLAGSEFQLFKVGLPETLDYPEWLNKNLKTGEKVGFDSTVLPVTLYKKLVSTFSLKKIEIVDSYDIISEVWEDRPAIPQDKIFVQPVKYAGKSRVEKFNDIRNIMNDKGADTHLFCTLDDINWTFNIRGYDVTYNPVAICYALITNNTAELYIDSAKLTDEIKAELINDGVKLLPYNDIFARIANLPAGSNIVIDTARTNAKLYYSVPSSCTVIEDMNVSTKLKAIKNPTEVQGIKNAMRRDCVAMVKFWNWFEKNLPSGELSEISTGDKMKEFRQQSEMFYGESFGTIAGYKGHGAIVHYGATEESNSTIYPDGFFLFDSGAQYFDGTTDITRTFHLGTPTEQEKMDYTLVLKGHINLSLAKFPLNTRGSQLDVLARKFLWDNRMQYMHGTGHGVGCFMNVHEGPQSIRMDENPNVLVPGMFTSNEPGLYRTDQYGIRIENLVLTVEDEKSEFGQFLKFDTMTLFPIETKAINKDLLTELEIKWLNDYHQFVYDEVSPMLDDEHKAWLLEKTKAI